MKKKMFCLAVVFSCAFLFSVLAYADYDWPPPAPDVPATVLTEEMMKKSFSGLKLSLQSMGDTGLQIQGVLISILLISSIFYSILLNKFELFKGVRRREFNRKINFLDRKKNLDSIVDDKVGQMEVNLLAKNRFRLKHPFADLDEKIYQRELSYQADKEMQNRHPGWALEKSIFRKEINAYANMEFSMRQHELDIEARVNNKEMNFEAEGEFQKRNAEKIHAVKVLSKEANAQAEIDWHYTFGTSKELRELRKGNKK